MIHLWQGIQLGLVLAILVGPLLFALVQISLEQGSRSGLMVGAGIWISDLLYILAVYFGMTYVDRLVQWHSFEFTLGLAGAVVLLAVGINNFVKPAPKFQDHLEDLSRYDSYWSLWLKGFLINTINPFTVFFWVSVMTGVVLDQELTGGESTLFFSGILGVIITTDSLKVFLAKKIRHKLKEGHFQWIRWIAGGALIVFAIILAIRVMV